MIDVMHKPPLSLIRVSLAYIVLSNTHPARVCVRACMWGLPAETLVPLPSFLVHSAPRVQEMGFSPERLPLPLQLHRHPHHHCPVIETVYICIRTQTTQAESLILMQMTQQII